MSGKGTDDMKEVCPESTLESANRRSFVKRAAAGTAAVVLAGTLAGKAVIPESSASPAYEYCCLSVKNEIFIGKCNPGGTKLCANGNVNATGNVCVVGNVNATGSLCVKGGIFGQAQCPPVCRCGVMGAGVIGWGYKGGVAGGSPICGGIGVLAYSGNFDGTVVPLVAQGSANQNVNLQIWEKKLACQSLDVLSVVNKCGWLGIGTAAPSTPLEVVGGSTVVGPLIQGIAGNTCAIPFVAQGANGQTANLQQWEKGAAPLTTVLSVVNKCGWFGIGTSTPSTPLDVVGAATVDGSLTALAGATGTVPIVAKGASGQTANLQQWENSCGTVFAVINNAGSLGLGGVTKPRHVLCISGKAHASSGFSIGPCTCINTTLVVNGSMAAKTRCVSASGCLATTDYGIFASGAITLTLPPAKTQKGMMLFIKNTSTSTVTIKPGATDTIEGATSSSPKTLGKQYDSLTLISNGSNEWYIQSGVKCGAVIS